MVWCSVHVNKLMYGEAFYYESEYKFRIFFFHIVLCKSLKVIRSYDFVIFYLRSCNAIV